jgi:hypothetical protein
MSKISKIVKKRDSSGLDKIIAGIVSIVVFSILASMLLAGKTSGNYSGSLFLVIVGTVLTWLITLEVICTEPKTKVHNEKLEQKRVAYAQFMQDSKSYVDETFIGTYVGVSGNELQEKNKVLIGCGSEYLYIGNVDKFESETIPFAKINLFEISGAGTVTTNAGVVGGGFGVEGFIKGAVVAEILNKSTTRSTTNTFIRVMTGTSEMYFHTSEREPAQLQIIFSKVFVMLNSAKNTNVSATAKTTSISDELTKLHGLFKEGVLTQDEFDSAKRNLLEG